MAYSVKLAAALTGATPAQLRYWRSQPPGHPLLPPEISDERPLLYSIRDLVALRMFVFLREDVSLQRIRRAVAQLRDLGRKKHLSEYRLVTVGKTVALHTVEETVDLVDRPGQMILDLSRVMQPFDVAGDTVPDLWKPRELIEHDPGRLGGTPTIKGTRIPYDAVAGLVEEGVPLDAVAKFYPHVSAEAARQALSFARYVERRGAESDVA